MTDLRFNPPAKTGVNFNSGHVLTLLIAIAVLLCGTAPASAQKKPKYYIGDIVEYQDSYAGKTYGLILGVKPKIKIERLDERAGFKEGRPSRSGTVTLIDSLRKREKPRRWESADGEFTLQATLVDFDDETVRLKNAEGDVLPVPKSKLCQKDHDYLGRSDLEKSKNPFEVDASANFPQEVLDLIKRRGQLLELLQRHHKLARLRREPMVGDIVKYQTRSGSLEYGIIYSLDGSGKVEMIDEEGNPDQVSTSLKSLSWWYFDREVKPIMARSWKSASGKFSIEAKLVGIDGGNVVLEKLDGGRTSVPLAKLSSSSQQYVEKYRPRFENSADEVAATRENYDAKLKTLVARRSELLERLRNDSIAAKEAANIAVVKLTERPIQLTAEQLKPESLNGKSFSTSVGIEVAASSKIESVSYSKDSGLVAFTTDPRTGTPKLFVVGVDSSSVFGSDPKDRIGEDAKVLSISPSGQTILVFSEDERRKQQLELWKFAKGELTRTATVPYKSNRTPNATLFSDTNGIILNAYGEAVFFNIGDRITPTHIVSKEGPTRNGAGLQVSDDRKSIFYFGAKGNELYVVDIESKRCVGGIRYAEEELLESGSAKVNEDGKTASFFRIDKEGKRTMALVDLKTGDLTQEHPLPVSQSISTKLGDVPSLGPNLVLSSSLKIFDARLGVVIGNVKSGERYVSRAFSKSSRITAKIEENKSSKSTSRGGFGGTTIGVVEEDVPSRIDIKSETFDVQEVVAYADSLSKADIVTFGSGSTLSLDIDLGDDSSEKSLVSQLTSKMSDAGIKIGEGSDFVLKVRFLAGKPVTETFNIVEVHSSFRHFRIPNRFNSTPTGQKRTVTVTPKTTSARLMYKGSVLWAHHESAALGRPYSVDELNKRVSEARQLTARKTLQFEYPTEIITLDPKKKREFEWR